MPASLVASQFETLEAIRSPMSRASPSMSSRASIPFVDEYVSRTRGQWMNSTAVLAEAPELVQPVASGWQLVLAFLAGIAVIVVPRSPGPGCTVPWP